MHKTLAFIVFLALFISCNDNREKRLDRADTIALTIPQEARQLVEVTAPDNTSTTAEMQRFEKVNGKWVKQGSKVEVSLGRSGLAWGRGIHPTQPGEMKKEGDGKSPSGIFKLTGIFGYAPADSVRFNLPYHHANDVLECVDDSQSSHYNQLVDSLSVKKDWNSSEFMRLDDHQYKYGVLVAHNTEAEPMGGSCIFLHIWKKPGEPTSGCTAMAEEDLLELINWLDEKKNPVLVQLTEADADKWLLTTNLE